MTHLDRYRIAMERTAKFHGYVPPRPFAVHPALPIIRAPRPAPQPRIPAPLPTRARRYSFIGPYLIPHEVKRSIPISVIQDRVASYYHIPPLEMTSDRRAREVSRPRQVSMYLSKMFSPRSLVYIGKLHGGRDHTTVIHAVRAIEKARAEDPAMDRDVLAIARALA